jgi:hypothetical protein
LIAHLCGVESIGLAGELDRVVPEAGDTFDRLRNVLAVIDELVI